LRILFLSNLYPPHYLGGYEILCRQVAEWMAKQEHEVIVLASTHGVPSSTDDRIAGVDVHRWLELEVPFDQPWRSRLARRWSVARGNARITERALRQFAPDAAVAWSQLRLTLAPAAVLTKARVPTLFALNDASLGGFGLPSKGLPRIRRAIRQGIMPGSSINEINLEHATVISVVLRTDLVEKGVPVSHARLIPQGIDLSMFPPREAPGRIDTPLRVCYCGQLHRYKGVHVAIDAAHRFVDQHGAGSLRLSVIGAGPADYENELRRNAAAGPAEVQFHGRLPHEELASLYRAHDVLVFPSSWREPFGLTHLEAMASGLVVVSTLNGGQREFLRDEVNCLTFPADDPVALAGCLTRLRQKPQVASRLAEAGLALVRSDFTLERYAARLLQMVEAAHGGASR
jgi:glycosyltransferase involved in cell wall biosynthesis